MNFNSFEDYDSSSIFGDDTTRQRRSEFYGISVERLNALFHSGAISSQEHSHLISTLFPSPARISKFAIASFVVSICSWVLMLKYTSSGETYELLNGDGRTVVMTLLSPIALALAYVGMREIQLYENMKGKEFVFATLTFSGFMFVAFVVPYWLFLK
jgi:hypothetical protein